MTYRVTAGLLAVLFVVSGAPALAQTSTTAPTPSNDQAQSGGTTTTAPAAPVRRRRCETQQAMGSNFGRRVCAMYTDEEWAARRRMNQEQQRQTTDVCNRGGAMESC